jgi:hypothetical protein
MISTKPRLEAEAYSEELQKQSVLPIAELEFKDSIRADLRN